MIVSLKWSRKSFGTGVLHIYPYHMFGLNIKLSIIKCMMWFHCILAFLPSGFSYVLFFVSTLLVTTLWTPFQHPCPSYSPFLPSAWLQRQLRTPICQLFLGLARDPLLLGNLLYQPLLIQLMEQKEACSSAGKWRGPQLEPWGIPVSLLHGTQ